MVGIIHEIGAAGVFIRAIDLSYFEDWCQSIANGEPYLSMSDYFFPMWRLERIIRDEAPSFSDQFEKRTGKLLGEF